MKFGGERNRKNHYQEQVFAFVVAIDARGIRTHLLKKPSTTQKRRNGDKANVMFKYIKKDLEVMKRLGHFILFQSHRPFHIKSTDGYVFIIFIGYFKHVPEISCGPTLVTGIETGSHLELED